VDDPVYLLVHSPVVGPLSWSRVAEVLERKGRRTAVPSLLGVQDSPPPHWRWCADRLVDAVGREETALVLVGHSGAGPLLPIVGTEVAVDVRAYVFVDATIPERTGSTPLIPAELLQVLEALAVDGTVPKWSRWWDDQDAMRGLVPDEALRARLEDELPSLPLTYFKESIPVPEGWPDAACGYLRFSAVYERDEREAASRGWRTQNVPGEHFHTVVDPEAVASAIVDLAEARE
jgi:hypothetical protein